MVKPGFFVFQGGEKIGKNKCQFSTTSLTLTEPEELLLVTVYDPSRHPYEWVDNYRKRKE